MGDKDEVVRAGDDDEDVGQFQRMDDKMTDNTSAQG